MSDQLFYPDFNLRMYYLSRSLFNLKHDAVSGNQEERLVADFNGIIASYADLIESEDARQRYAYLKHG